MRFSGNSKREAFLSGGAFLSIQKKFRAFGAIINKSMILYCFTVSWNVITAGGGNFLLFLTLFLQFLLLKQRISKGFVDPKPPPPKSPGGPSDKKAPLILITNRSDGVQ